MLNRLRVHPGLYDVPRDTGLQNFHLFAKDGSVREDSTQLEITRMTSAMLSLADAKRKTAILYLHHLLSKCRQQNPGPEELAVVLR